MLSYEFSFFITKLGFFLGFFVNNFLIYITVSHVRKVDVTYKMMVAFFAMLGLFFTGWGLIAKPFMHNFNESFVFFSLRTTVSQKFFQFSAAFYAGISIALLALLSVQFVFRYFVLLKPEAAKKSDGSGGVFWLIYPTLPGLLYYCSFYLYCLPDHYADTYVSTEMRQKYGLDINIIPRFTIMSYNSDESIRWSSVCFLIQCVLIIGFHYGIIIFYGIKTHLLMKKKLHEFSTTNARLHSQIFKALIVQVLVPTFMFVLPGGVAFVGPFLSSALEMDVSLRSGWLLSVFSTYPVIDCILFMIIVTEYKRSVANRVVGVFQPNAAFSAQSFTIDVRARVAN